MRVKNDKLAALGFAGPPARLRGFGNFGGIIPYTVPGLPAGALEMGLGGLAGYLIGNQRDKGLVGLLFGVAAGALLAQVQPAVAGQTPTQLTGQGALVPAQPGLTAAGATPDKNPDAFDWDEASGIVQKVLTDKQLIGAGKEIYGIIAQAWGSKTRVPATANTAAQNSGYLPWSGEPFYSDPASQPGGYVLLDNSTLQNPPQTSEDFYTPVNVATDPGGDTDGLPGW